MLWYIATAIFSFVLGAIASALLIIFIYRQRVKSLAVVTDNFGEIMEQFARTQEYLNTLPVKDERLVNILQGNARVLGKLKYEFENTEGIELPEDEDF